MEIPKPVIARFTESLVRRCVRVAVLESVRDTALSLALWFGVGVALVLAAWAIGMLSNVHAIWLIAGLGVALLAVALIYVNSYWQNLQQAMHVFRNSSPKDIEVDLSEEGCKVSVGSRSRLIPWSAFVQSKIRPDVIVLKFSTQKDKLSAAEIGALAKRLSVRKGGEDLLGFPVFGMLPMPQYEFVVLPRSSDWGIRVLAQHHTK